MGGAVVSDLHANWILNDRGASAADVRTLGLLMQATVARETGVTLAFEIKFAGDWSSTEGEPA